MRSGSAGSGVKFTEGDIREFRRQDAWRDAASETQIEMKRLRGMRRSWLRAAPMASNAEEFRAAARKIRRWMRPLRRQLRRERRSV